MRQSQDQPEETGATENPASETDTPVEHERTTEEKSSNQSSAATLEQLCGPQTTIVDDHTDDESRMLVEETKLDEDEACSLAKTYEALLLTTYSTVAFTRHLLSRENFRFVLSRKFNSDPIESLFGTLRKSLGSNDTLDVRSVMSGLEKLLKMGIAAGPEGSNVLHEQEFEPSNALPAVTCTPKDPSELSRGATDVLKRFKVKTVQAILPTLQVTTTVYMGGYIARVVREHIDCDYCCQLTSKSPSSQPLQQFTRQQDRGGLVYPSDELLHVLETLTMLASCVLQERSNLQRPLTSLLNVAVPALVDSAPLKCAIGDDQHHQDLAELVCSHIIKPLLVNYASAATDRSDEGKNFTRKPLLRKYLRL
ncbi:hypothetical protein HPB51_015776 [Rhipicephalus microplus]|uniref:Transposable element n=1 Tax=Rhipicephalus microplus TaxID=6941 RepID=A0A9J6EI89_RHIMP|nr:hypothetical protein HPB51_015776 [Rhipicephalus microplus]